MLLTSSLFPFAFLCGLIKINNLFISSSLPTYLYILGLVLHFMESSYCLKLANFGYFIITLQLLNIGYLSLYLL